MFGLSMAALPAVKATLNSAKIIAICSFATLLLAGLSAAYYEAKRTGAMSVELATIREGQAIWAASAQAVQARDQERIAAQQAENAQLTQRIVTLEGLPVQAEDPGDGFCPIDCTINPEVFQ